MDKSYQHVLNTGGSLVRTHEKWNGFIPMMFHMFNMDPKLNIN